MYSFNTLKPKLVWINFRFVFWDVLPCKIIVDWRFRGACCIFKNPGHTSKKTTHFIITNINLLTLMKELIPVYNENHTEPISTKIKLQIIKVAGTYSYRSTLKGSHLFLNSFAVPSFICFTFLYLSPKYNSYAAGGNNLDCCFQFSDVMTTHIFLYSRSTFQSREGVWCSSSICTKGFPPSLIHVTVIIIIVIVINKILMC
jgi:hypothetical protein